LKSKHVIERGGEWGAHRPFVVFTHTAAALAFTCAASVGHTEVMLLKTFVPE
jgi:hypothetical protein